MPLLWLDYPYLFGEEQNVERGIEASESEFLGKEKNQSFWGWDRC